MRAAVGAVAAGGVLGALSRWGVSVTTGGGPWVILGVNALGCFAIGAVAVWTRPGSLLRLFWATGVLGGFTTFSAYAVDAVQLARDGRLGTAAAYVAGTIVAALIAVRAGGAIATRTRGRRATG
jgi:CrcB protein